MSNLSDRCGMSTDDLIAKLEGAMEALEEKAVDMVDVDEGRAVILPADRDLFNTILVQIEDMKDLISLLRCS